MKIGARIANYIAAFSGLFFCLELLAQTAPQTTSVNADNAFDLQAHRGGLGLVVESSLQGFANALELGVSTLELDIQITRDRIAVVTHDRQVLGYKCLDTEPASAGDVQFPYVGRYIKDLTLTQLQTLDCGSQRQQAYPGQRLLPGMTMPTLKDVLDLVRLYGADITLNIETKVEAGAPHETAPREQFVEIVIAQLREADLLGQATIQSFDWGTLMRVRESEPALPIVALSNGQQFLRCGEAGVSPWTGGIDLDDFDCDLPAAAASFAADAISPVHGTPQDGSYGEPGYEPFVTPEMVSRAHARGLKVIPWTVNDRATIEYLLDSGVDGIITDYPDRIRALLDERGLPLPRIFRRPQDCEERLEPDMNPQLCELDQGAF